VVGADAQIGAGRVGEAADDEACPGNQDQRECKFGNDQQTAQANMAPARGGTATFFQHVADVLARGVPGGSAAEEDAGE